MGFLDNFRSKPPTAAKDELPTEELAGSSGSTASRIQPPAADASELPSGDTTYNPYKGLQLALDTRGSGDPTIKSGFKLPQRPEFVFVEEGAVRRRSWSENITYYTGAGYLGGAIMGGSMGAMHALQASPGVSSPTMRMQVNRLLNTCGGAGRLYGNSVGVIGLYFAASESLLFNYLESYGVPDEVPTLGAGFITGNLYRITRGPRPAAVAGLVGTAGAGVLLLGRS
eukprot:CAMPEP_0117679736 /NCGR_PEP_ID=MMETSP0804-20121206/17970_1 /TAXON_ID=1074897 /ORGANISM="Tetraselmis astigmatica, Strain CCMP880" /LENGTH=226 /DNA_ID=CAMNT_0005489171 /DNA_START=21 /DNA_END=698 /DNA_ORIENTATION=-